MIQVLVLLGTSVFAHRDTESQVPFSPVPLAPVVTITKYEPSGLKETSRT